jgi:hypothetical protein
MLSKLYLTENFPTVISHSVNLLSNILPTIVVNISEGQTALENSRIPPVVITQANYNIHVYYYNMFN